MKIVHVTQWFAPGLGYQENHLPYQQKQLGHEVWIIASDRLRPRGNGYQRVRFVTGTEKVRGVPVRRLNGLWISKVRAQIFLKELNRVLALLKPDVVHAHGLWTTPTLELLLRQRPAYRLFVDDHVDDDTLALDQWQTHLRVRVFRHFLLPILKRRVIKFISVNRYSERFLIDWLKLPTAKVELLPLGIDDETFYPSKSARMEYRNKLDVATNDVVVVTSGNIDPTKGVDLLIKVLGSLRRRHENLRLLIVGRGPERYVSHLKNMVEEFGMPGTSVYFHDWVSQEELCKIYNASDVAVMPRKLSGIKEALAVGLPLIVSKHLATEYFVKNGNGLTFKRDNVKDLKATLERYLADCDLRNRHGAHSIELVRSELSWRTIAQRSVEIYSSTLG